MDQTAETTTRRPAPLRFARLLGFSGLAAIGMVGLGLAFSSTSASADEAPSSLLGGVTSAVGQVAGSLDAPVAAVGQTAGGAVSQVTDVAVQATAVAPPVQHVVQAAAPVVPQAVQHVTAVAPVSSVVAPVAQTVDQVVAAVPVVSAVTGPAPVSTVTDPLTGVVDGGLAAVGDSAAAPAEPIVPPVVPEGVTPRPGVTPPASDALTGAAADAVGIDALGADVVTAASDADAATAATDATDAVTTLRAQIAAGPASASDATTVPLAPTPGPTPRPAGDDHGTPALPSSTGGSANGQASGGGAAGGAVALDATRASQLPGLAVSAGSADGDDDLPSTPAYDTDSSPD
ncbi:MULTISPECIES: hypothetical protein [unclassified Frigoribacterium]|uniref:hypothetical protein n=1 Tax=unclassified Frigoribacterium TaxID=2627005 RepID=UPI0007011903|nr:MULTISPECIES: hypothetical protein [unclassified Frigoribacterium]KQO45262.1 hypothetical protein ASF07_13885 [Frigoribacterium sp. Leaf254]KQT36964.1 hypothetical protein ASG28_14680 [Frigoribacterium sp. Leaf415]